MQNDEGGVENGPHVYSGYHLYTRRHTQVQPRRLHDYENLGTHAKEPRTALHITQAHANSDNIKHKHIRKMVFQHDLPLKFVEVSYNEQKYRAHKPII